jgi:hypothetical protein
MKLRLYGNRGILDPEARVRFGVRRFPGRTGRRLTVIFLGPLALWLWVLRIIEILSGEW